MNATSSSDLIGHRYPSLFGRTTAVLNGHKRLAATVENLREMCRVVRRGTTSLPAELEPIVLFQTLLEELDEHFQVEESSDYFGTVEAARPELRQAIAELRREHTVLLEAVSALVIASTDGVKPGTLLATAEQMMKQLEGHERSESALMGEFLSGR